MSVCVYAMGQKSQRAAGSTDDGRARPIEQKSGNSSPGTLRAVQE